MIDQRKLYLSFANFLKLTLAPNGIAESFWVDKF